MKLGALLAKREAMGVGDVWLLAGLGAFLGAGALLPVVMLASIQGSAVGLLLVALGRAQPGPDPEQAADDTEWVPPRNGVPFGPFLVARRARVALRRGRGSPSLVPALDVFR